MDSILIAQNIILRYRLAQGREWHSEVSLPLRERIDKKELYRIRQRNRRLQALDIVESSDSNDSEGLQANKGKQNFQIPLRSGHSKIKTTSPDSEVPGYTSSTSCYSPPEQASPTSEPSISIPAAMAVPPEVTIDNLSGTYLLNRHLSDSSQTVLKMQGVNFVVRSAVAYSNVTVTLSQYTDDSGRKHLDQEQLSTGGVKNFEDRIMDGAYTEKYNWIWGKVNGKSQYIKLDEIEDGYLKEGWSKDCVEGELVEGYVESVTDKWTARQIWGFAEVDGERKHVRKILATKPGWKEQRIRMVYDWKPAA